MTKKYRVWDTEMTEEELEDFSQIMSKPRSLVEAAEELRRLVNENEQAIKKLLKPKISPYNSPDYPLDTITNPSSHISSNKL